MGCAVSPQVWCAKIFDDSLDFELLVTSRALDIRERVACIDESVKIPSADIDGYSLCGFQT